MNLKKLKYEDLRIHCFIHNIRDCKKLHYMELKKLKAEEKKTIRPVNNLRSFSKNLLTDEKNKDKNIRRITHTIRLIDPKLQLWKHLKTIKCKYTTNWDKNLNAYGNNIRAFPRDLNSIPNKNIQLWWLRYMLKSIKKEEFAKTIGDDEEILLEKPETLVHIEGIPFPLPENKFKMIKERQYEGLDLVLGEFFEKESFDLQYRDFFTKLEEEQEFRQLLRSRINGINIK